MPALTKNSFSQASQAEVGSLEGLTPLLVQGELLALDENRTTSLQHALGGTLHHQQVPGVARILERVDGQLLAEGDTQLLAARRLGGSMGVAAFWGGRGYREAGPKGAGSCSKQSWVVGSELSAPGTCWWS